MKNIYVIALAAILFQGCGQKKEMTAPATRPVKTTIVESRSVIRKDFSGIVEAVEYVKLAFRVSGQIISLPVIEGEKVKKGQLIAAIDPRDIALQYAATKSAYETASAQVERNKRLLSRQAISVHGKQPAGCCGHDPWSRRGIRTGCSDKVKMGRESKREDAERIRVLSMFSGRIP